MDVRQRAGEGWEAKAQPAKRWARTASRFTRSSRLAAPACMHPTGRPAPTLRSHFLSLGKAPGRPHSRGMLPGSGTRRRSASQMSRCSSHCMVHGRRWGRGRWYRKERLSRPPQGPTLRPSPAHLQLRQLWEQQPGIGRARRRGTFGRAGCVGTVHPVPVIQAAHALDLRHPARSVAGHKVPQAGRGVAGGVGVRAGMTCAVNAMPMSAGGRGAALGVNERPCRRRSSATHQWWAGLPGLQPAQLRPCEMPRAAATLRRCCMMAASSAAALPLGMAMAGPEAGAASAAAPASAARARAPAPAAGTSSSGDSSSTSRAGMPRCSLCEDAMPMGLWAERGEGTRRQAVVPRKAAAGGGTRPGQCPLALFAARREPVDRDLPLREAGPLQATAKPLAPHPLSRAQD